MAMVGPTSRSPLWRYVPQETAAKTANISMGVCGICSVAPLRHLATNNSAAPGRCHWLFAPKLCCFKIMTKRKNLIARITHKKISNVHSRLVGWLHLRVENMTWLRTSWLKTLWPSMREADLALLFRHFVARSFFFARRVRVIGSRVCCSDIISSLTVVLVSCL